jgi:tRNA 2-thiouridine synthesizing protein C
MAHQRKKTLLILRRAPYGDSLGRAALDVALASAAFEQDISVLFMDDGVWQLLPEQEASAINHKSAQRTLASFGLYDINTFYVEKASLAMRNLDPAQLEGPVELIAGDKLASFIDSYEQLLSF